jgi:uncharacterized membrane protein YphA (DoxX/SURF4 family)
MNAATNDLAFWALLGRLAVAAVLIVAGASKIGAPAGFESALARYDLLPGRLVFAVSRALPVSELAAGSLLAVGLAVRVVAPLCALLLMAFAAAMAANLARGRVVDCGCGGNASGRITWWHFAFDLGLALTAALVALAASPAIWTWPASNDLVPALLTLAGAAVARSLVDSGWRALRAVAR